MSLIIDVAFDVAEQVTGIPREEICGSCRQYPVVQARHIAMHLMHKPSHLAAKPLSTPATGKAFERDDHSKIQPDEGLRRTRKDHSTVVHALQKIEDAIAVANGIEVPGISRQALEKAPDLAAKVAQAEALFKQLYEQRGLENLLQFNPHLRGKVTSLQGALNLVKYPEGSTEDVEEAFAQALKAASAYSEKSIEDVLKTPASDNLFRATIYLMHAHEDSELPRLGASTIATLIERDSTMVENAINTTKTALLQGNVRTWEIHEGMAKAFAAREEREAVDFADTSSKPGDNSAGISL